jgi:hypothetical protein
MSIGAMMGHDRFPFKPDNFGHFLRVITDSGSFTMHALNNLPIIYRKYGHR